MHFWVDSRGGSPGFSLIEAVCSLGLVALTLLGAAGLLVTATRQIHGAGRLSVAQAIDRIAVTELSGSSLARACALLECDTALPLCEAGPGQATVEAWAALAGQRLGRGELRVRLDALDAPRLADALSIRITASVRWSEGPRNRQVSLVTVRG